MDDHTQPVQKAALVDQNPEKARDVDAAAATTLLIFQPASKKDIELVLIRIDGAASATTYSIQNERDKRKYADGDPRMSKGTIIAGVLARLLKGGMPLTVWEAVDTFRTTHLTAAIRTLKKKYGWPIECVEFPTFVPDGICYVKGYKLSQPVIDHAYQDLDARSWIEGVDAAQVRKRAINMAKAAALNQYRFIIDHPYVYNADQTHFRHWVGL